MESIAAPHEAWGAPRYDGSESSSLCDGDESSQTSPSEIENSGPPGASNIPDPELDGYDEADPIAICGFSIKFPQDATSPEAFWKMMVEKRCAMTDFPANRINTEGFYQKQGKSRLNTLPLRGGCFVKDDLGGFDADFFSISPAEAASMDPMQRWLLEAAFGALENAGIPMESVSGSSTAVYTGSFSLDYMLQLSRDPECPPKYAAVGFGLSMLANRLSWFFNLRGPSIGLDSACSSTAMAVDIACQALHNGSCNMAMVAGSNLVNSPESYIWMTNINFLSPDGRCYPFDHRANGYARGEGVGVVVLKRLSDAIRDGNTIRAVIRSTGSNEDGRTPGITQPSRTAQERLIRETYQKAGLSMAHTRFFEAHGTGTAIGDPREAQAIGSAFQKYRSVEDPLYVGALKSNIGHLEGASGLAAVIKAVLALEKGIIPPNTNFEKVNPKIDTQFLRLKFPEESHPWPTPGLRRASINSFGYGGSNSHIVLDDAYNYLRLRSLPGEHCTSPSPTRTAPVHRPINDSLLTGSGSLPPEDGLPKLFVWSAADKNGISRIGSAYHGWYGAEKSLLDIDEKTFLGNLAYTLDSHRSQLQWRSFALLQAPAELNNLQSRMSSAIRVRSEAPRIGFVFSGQGSQWFAMGRELMSYSSFKAELDRAGAYLQSLGCCWSATDELLKPEGTSDVDRAEFSQTLCTVLQVALVNLLRRFDIRPSAVVGHSSGEIAAAYAGGYLSRESAWKLAFFRGICSAELSETPTSQCLGTMMSVGLSESSTRELLATVDQSAAVFGVTIACINSPSNVTISGENHMIDMLKTRLDEQKVFARKLRVKLAYHSRQMEAILAKYKSMIGSLSGPDEVIACVPMISSVTGERAPASALNDPSYWVLNMASPVQFSQAVSVMCAQSPAELVKKIDKSHVFVPVVDHLVELGPHATLQGPLRDILKAVPRGSSIGYSSVLRRGQSAVDTMLHVMGELHCMGSTVNFRAINEPSGEVKASRSLLVNLPDYPFDRSQHYWHEGRLSRNYRLREHAPSELLGVRSRDWNASDARWQHFIRTSEMPWTEQHVVNNMILYPATGMIVMAIEAAKQLAGEANDIDGYMLRDVHIEGPMNLSSSGGSLEIQTSLRELQPRGQSGPRFEFIIRTYTNDDWLVNCRGFITAELSATMEKWTMEKTVTQRQNLAEKFSDLRSHCETSVDSQHMYRFLKQSGYEYGQFFQSAKYQRCNERTKKATAEVNLFRSCEEDHVVHPVSLDAIFHLCFTAFTSGGSRPMATCIPSRIDSLWLSNEGLNWPEQEKVTACITDTRITRRGFSCNGGALDSCRSERLRLWYEGLELTKVTAGPLPSSLPNPKQFCMNIDRKVALNKLTYSETRSFLDSLHPVPQDLSIFFRDLELLVEMSLNQLISLVDPSTLESQEPWKRRYWSWAEHHLAGNRRKRRSDNSHHQVRDARQSFQDVNDRLRNTNHVGCLYATVASNLVALFSGAVSPLELLMQTSLLKNYYAELAEYRHTLQAASYIDLLAHQAPGMNILEVGGGTASATRRLISALSASPNDAAGSLRCKRYDFTDVSSAFLEQAREEFVRFHSQMTFGTLDIERDFAEQGFQEGIYDVVVAGDVLHVTSDLAQTLRNVRKALKPGGKLIMTELLKPDGWTAGFVFGLFPGWWLGAEDSRLLSPNLTAEDWNPLLKNNGFSGADMVFRDFDDDVAHHLGCLVATATEETPSLATRPRQTRAATIVINQTSAEQLLFAKSLLFSLQDLLGVEPRVLSIEEAAAGDQERSADELVILLADYGSSWLGALNETTWVHLQSLVQTSHQLLWVSAGGGRNASPDHGLLDGLARTLRFEYYELHLVTVALDIRDPNTNKVAFLLQIASEMVSRAPHESYEQDYVEIDGRLHTQRLVEAHDLKSGMEAKLMPYEVVPTPLGQVRFKMSLTSPLSPENDPHYALDSSVASEIELIGDVVTIEVKAVSLQSQDHAAAVGQQEVPSFGSYCSGVVLQSGPKAEFRPGDCVLAAQAGSFRSHVQVPSQAVAKIPPDLSFADACWVVPPMLMAYHALVEVGGAKRGDSVLVHNGASLVGQAAIQLLADRGITEVWTTAASEEESAAIAKNSGISQKRILPKVWFDNNQMLVSPWERSFHTIFSPNTDSTTPFLMNHVRSGGRYVVLQTKSSSSSNTHQVYRAPPNVSLTIIQPESCTAIIKALRHAAGISHTGTLKNTRHYVTELAASDLTTIFTHLQNVDERETIVVTFDENEIINVRMETRIKYELNPEATYLIAGGLGGLGRAMARWLVSRGARHLILLSRSGPRTPEARELLIELAEKRVIVEAPACDVTDSGRLRSVLAICSERMPPIKGCIQSSMVMTERIFQQMGFRDWKDTVAPKVKGSWNLHTELPGSLDFFIFISSMMGVIGSGSLSAYNAGNTYEDALARMRVSQGERAIALNLGAVPDGGYLVNHNTNQVSGMLRAEKYALTQVRDLCALLDIFCDPQSPLPRCTIGCQAIVGIRPPVHWKHVEEVPATMCQPFWGHMHHIPALTDPQGSISGDDSADRAQGKRALEVAERLAAAGSLAEGAEVVSEALAQRISVLLGTAEDRLDAQKPMHSYGLDSLSAIDVRNWVGKVFDVDMPVFEILGATFASAGMSIARKVQQPKH